MSTPVTGPYDTEAQALELPEVRAVYEAFDADPGAGKMAPHTRRMLDTALQAAGVDMGAYDNRIAAWLSQWEPQTVAVIAGWVSRAYRPELEEARAVLLAGDTCTRPDGTAVVSATDLGTVWSALFTAADHKRDLVDNCTECTGQPDTGLCGDCQEWLADADGYDSLADRLDPGPAVTRDGLASAFPEWEITETGDSIWTARLTTSEDRPQPRLIACTPAELAAALNDFIGGAR